MIQSIPNIIFSWFSIFVIPALISINIIILQKNWLQDKLIVQVLSLKIGGMYN